MAAIFGATAKKAVNQIKNANIHNLVKLSVKIPLGLLVAITGVSGAGKSTLVHDVLAKNVKQVINRKHKKPIHCKEITGLENIDRLIQIDQSPIGKSRKCSCSID